MIRKYLLKVLQKDIEAIVHIRSKLYIDKWFNEIEAEAKNIKFQQTLDLRLNDIKRDVLDNLKDVEYDLEYKIDSVQSELDDLTDAEDVRYDLENQLNDVDYRVDEIQNSLIQTIESTVNQELNKYELSIQKN